MCNITDYCTKRVRGGERAATCWLLFSAAVEVYVFIYLHMK